MTYLLETLEYLLSGMGVSLKIFVVTLVFSFPLSVLLSMVYRQNIVVKKCISFYTWLFRGTPLMLQLILIMYGLPAIGIDIDRMMVAYIGFMINYTAYFTEILRAGIESLPKDQFESAEILGATSIETFRFVILPQVVRIQLPVFTNETITLIKDTALVTVIALPDIMRKVKEVISRDFTISPFILAGAFYLFISYLIIKIAKRVEKKYDFLESTSI